MRRIILFIGILCFLFMGIRVGQSATTTSITQRGITWHFNKSYEYGKFANGDYWVVGPVTITSITPDFDGKHNGWEVNPAVGAYHGFDNLCKNGGFNADIVPSMPYTTKLPIESIVKTISSGLAQPCVRTAAVLTVLPSAPANNGSTVFRPPYAGTSKPLYSTSKLRTDLLPSLVPVGTPPSLTDVKGKFDYLRLEHLTSNARRDCRPSDAVENYNPKNQPGNHDALLRLMLNDSIQNKMPALIAVVQHGIDQAHIIIDGWETWMGDGHDPGHRIIGAFAATMLDITAARTKLAAATNFHEDHYTDYTALWGEGSTEDHYWTYVRGLGSGRSNRDPYGFIDGGMCGTDYQLIVSQSWKSSVLVTSVMPSIQSAWNPTKLAVLRRYVERWVNTGVWAQPDPCAPYTAYGVYGVHYGPDPRNPGMCILDPKLKYYNTRTDFQCSAGVQCGRYPTKHGTEKNGGMYRSDFVAAMWNAYYRYQQETQQMRPNSPTGLRLIQP